MHVHHFYHSTSTQPCETNANGLLGTLPSLLRSKMHCSTQTCQTKSSMKKTGFLPLTVLMKTLSHCLETT